MAYEYVSSKKVSFRGPWLNPGLDAVKAIEIVNYYQRRHTAAYHSHRNRRLAKLQEVEVSL